MEDEATRAAYETFKEDLLLPRLKAVGFTGKRVRNSLPHDVGFESGLPHLSYHFGWWDEPMWRISPKAGVYLWIREPTKPPRRIRATAIYGQLDKRRDVLTGEVRSIGPADELNRWNQRTNPTGAYHYCAVGMRKQIVIQDPMPMLEETADWMAAFGPVLRDVLTPHLREILADLA